MDTITTSAWDTIIQYFFPAFTAPRCEIIFWQTRFPVMLSKAKHLGRE
jgi:hypothetical protein